MRSLVARVQVLLAQAMTMPSRPQTAGSKPQAARKGFFHMNMLKKAVAAVSSFVLTFALMVPAVSWADDGASDEDAVENGANSEGFSVGLEVGISYNDQKIVLSGLPSVAHTISITFNVSSAYSAYDGHVSSSFALSSSDDMGKLRAAQSWQNADGSYTVMLSNGNGTLPLVNGVYLDLGELSVHVDGALDESSADSALMKQANVTVSELSVVDSDNAATVVVNSAASDTYKTASFELDASSFASVSGGVPALPDETPKVDAPDVNVPDGVFGPSASEVEDAVSGVAIPALWSLWNSANAEGVSAADQEAIKAFLERVRTAGYDFGDLAVSYDVDVKKYDGMDDVPEGDRVLLSDAFGDSYYELGYYDLKVTMIVSVPADPSLGSASAAIRELKAPLNFTVEVASGSLEGRVVSVGYVHDSKVGVIADGIEADERASEVTFPAARFSTYGVYAASENASGGNDGGSDGKGTTSPVASGLASTGDDARNPIMLLVGVAVLCGALAAVFARPRNRSRA